MLNYELIRAVHLDRERDVERAMRERSLRYAGAIRTASIQAGPGVPESRTKVSGLVVVARSR